MKKNNHFFEIINTDGENVTEQVILDVTEAIKKGEGHYGNDIKKSATITTAQGLVAYDLQAPSVNLIPLLTPFRNLLPRIQKPSGAGTGAHWVEVSSIEGSGKDLPWVPEGKRAGQMAITTNNRSANYKTIGEEASLTREAQHAGIGFEDVLAMNGARLLLSTMRKEEYALFGGNSSVSLGTPDAPVVTTVSSGGTIAAGTYNVKAVALTVEGKRSASLSSGVQQVIAIEGMDGRTFNLNGGSSALSPATSTGVLSGSTNIIKATVTHIEGAVGWAWYVGEAGSEKLEAITNINSVALTSLAGTHQPATEITADRSRNESLAFDGLFYSTVNSPLAYYKAMPTGAAGVGTGLTSTGDGTIAEIDEMLINFWDTYNIAPEAIYVNSRELLNIRKKVLTGTGTPLVHFYSNINDGQIPAGGRVGTYFNMFTMDGGAATPILLHPYMPAGTLFAWTSRLPSYYQNANIPGTAAVLCRQDYYQIKWLPTTREDATGVYAEEVLAVYAPFALGVITNIGNS